MAKTILITGSTDGIGLETARLLAARDNDLLLHGRSSEKLDVVVNELQALSKGQVTGYIADFSDLQQVAELADTIIADQSQLDVLINNAGVFRTAHPITPDGHDVRFVVNTLAPCVLTHRLLPLLGKAGRVVNLSSAAQAPVDLSALCGETHLADEFAAYAQSKLALTMWSRHMALENKEGPMIVAVNPGSMLGSKMVQEGFGVAGGDLRVGADILCRAALADEFATASGKYFDNDSGGFAAPHADALDAEKCAAVIEAIEQQLRAV